MFKKNEIFERICDLELQIEELEDKVWELMEKLNSKSKNTRKTKK